MPRGIYDPLYEYISFDRLVPPRRDNPAEPAFDLTEVIQTEEFTRQAFLRQNGMGFLVFPSSTHTRLAHALGACHLGRLAADRVRIREVRSNGTDQTVGLGEFLHDHEWGREFYLSLLLHDVGHFPFSHTVEHGHGVWEWFGGNYKHEEAACELVRGAGDFADAFRARAVKSAGGASRPRWLSEALRDCCTRGDRAIDAICYLILGGEADLAAFDEGERAELRLLHQLVSGLLDLDRMDHYRRDLYFNGVRSGTVLNFKCLLSGITITYNPGRHPPDLQKRDWNAVVSLNGSAWGQAVSLLQIKEQLLGEAFHDVRVLAYETMLGEALHAYIKHPETDSLEKPRRLFELLVLTDDQLLDALLGGGDDDVRTLVYRIRIQRPYRFLGKIVLSGGTPGKPLPDIGSVQEVVRDTCEPELGRMLIHGSNLKTAPKTPSGEGPRPDADAAVRIEKEWLDINELELEADPSVMQGGENPYRKNPSGFRPPQKPAIWLFSEADHPIEKVGRPIGRLREELRSRFGVIADVVCVPI